MKYIILVCDGAADLPMKELGNKTIFEAADTPSMDWIASHGQMGLLKTIPDDMAPGSAVANMTIMGYRPKTDFTGRGPLEALSAGMDFSETDIVFRCNLVTINEGLMEDYSSGHITTEESRPLIITIQSQLNREGIYFHPGVQYRHLLRLDGNDYSANIHLIPPHDYMGHRYEDILAKPIHPNDEKEKKTATIINELIEESTRYLTEHEINQTRARSGERMATHIWPWGGGKRPNIKPFKEKYGLSGSVISAVDLIFGIGIAAGLEPIRVKGATGLPDTNYQGKVDNAMQQLKENDYVYLHIEATDEMGHTGDPQKKINAVELFDQNIVKPFVEAENDFNNQLVVVVLPDHPTPCEKRTHTKEPVPFAIYKPQKALPVRSSRNYSESSGKEGELGLIEDGEEFMRLILN
jgi:2,3-bisphosphoglycerate-independent phosphoglycerate mutase